ncbi:MAG: TIGR04076 family protein [Ruminiclostridium sp.]|nr:TIGR04076 family protein [Ruminiclostridium sp.]
MKKWFAEDFEFVVEVTGFLNGDKTENYCRNGEEPGDVYRCTYGCPVNECGQGICSKAMMMLYPLMDAVRSGGDLTKLGGDSRLSKTVVCPDGCVIFRLTAKPLGNENFHTGGFWKSPDNN